MSFHPLPGNWKTNCLYFVKFEKKGEMLGSLMDTQFSGFGDSIASIPLAHPFANFTKFLSVQ